MEADEIIRKMEGGEIVPIEDMRFGAHEDSGFAPYMETLVGLLKSEDKEMLFCVFRIFSNMIEFGEEQPIARHTGDFIRLMQTGHGEQVVRASYILNSIGRNDFSCDALTPVLGEIEKFRSGTMEQRFNVDQILDNYRFAQARMQKRRKFGWQLPLSAGAKS